MVDQHGPAFADAILLRPAVDPAIPGPDRALLTAPGTVLTPASRARPRSRREWLPRDPAQRLATVDGAAIGMTSAMAIAVFGTVPLAVGILALQGSAAWESAASRYALLVAEIIAVITIVIFGFRVGRFGHLTGRVPTEQEAARIYHGRYLTDHDFDAPSRLLLRRAQDAIDAVTSSEVCQAEAASLAQTSVAGRVAALERYAADVSQADAAYLDWQQAARLAGLHAEHLDMLARTAADEHGISEIEAMSQRARAVRLAFLEPPA